MRAMRGGVTAAKQRQRYDVIRVRGAMRVLRRYVVMSGGARCYVDRRCVTVRVHVVARRYERRYVVVHPMASWCKI